MVQFKDVEKVYKDGTTAVKDIDFVIEEGEFVFLIGPSGSGKTTLIQLLIRDQVPTKGKIFLDDEDITHISRNKVYKHRRNIGVIFQDYKLIEDKTAYENVEFAMEAAGKSDKEIRETVPYVLDIVGLGTRMDAFPIQLSGGEQQRVAIARAIANNPKLLIADEPTGNLDPASAWDIVQILTKINNWGTTVLMSTHGTDIVNTLNKRVLQMENGMLTRDDNEGQYEFKSKADPELLKQMKADMRGREDGKKKGYTVKISKDMEVEDASKKKEEVDEDIDKANDVEKDDSVDLKSIEQGEISKPKKRGLFGRFFKRDDETSEASKIESEESNGESIKDVVEENTDKDNSESLGDEVMKDEEFEDKMTKMVDDAVEDEKEKKEDTSKKVKDPKAEKKGEKFHFKLGEMESVGIAGDIKKSSNKKKKKKTDDVNEFYEKNKNVSVNFLNLPTQIIKDMKDSGYKTVGSILKEGPEALLESEVIDKDEVILIAQAIEKLIEK